MIPEPSIYPYGAARPPARDAGGPREGTPPAGTGEPDGLDGPEEDPYGPNASNGAVATDGAFSDEYDDELDEGDDEGSDDGGPALSPADRTLIKALARGHTHQQAAALIGRAAKFVQRRLKDPVFAAALKRQRERYNEQLQGLFDDGAIEALRALKRLTHSERDADSIHACDVILGRSLQLRSLQARQDLDRRLAEIENLLVAEETLEDEAQDRGRR